MTLDEIALKHGTDKASSHHGYTRWYEQYFEPLRNEPINILELGWGGHEDPAQGGASAATWREYLPGANVVVIDVEAKANIMDGVNFHQGSQADPVFLAELHAEYGDWDIVIDDASHLSSLTIRSFELLYSMLTPGGLYVVEDTHMAYHSHYYGEDEANPDPDGRTSTGAPTAMQYFRRMADDVNHRGDDVLYPKKYWRGYSLEWAHFYFNILFLRKLP